MQIIHTDAWLWNNKCSKTKNAAKQIKMRGKVCSYKHKCIARKWNILNSRIQQSSMYSPHIWYIEYQSSSVNKVKREKNVLTRLLNFSGHISPNKLRAIMANIHLIMIIMNIILAMAGNALKHVLTIVWIDWIKRIVRRIRNARKLRSTRRTRSTLKKWFICSNCVLKIYFK